MGLAVKNAQLWHVLNTYYNVHYKLTACNCNHNICSSAVLHQSPDAQCAFQEAIENALNLASSTDKENQDQNSVAKSFTIEDDFSKTLSDVTGTCVHSAKPPRRGKPTKRTSTRKPFGKL